MTASIIPLQLILVAQLYIYHPSPFRPHKRARYTPDLLSSAICVASENYVHTFTTPSDSPDLLPCDDPNTLHSMKKDVPFQGRVNRGYCCRNHDQKR